MKLLFESWRQYLTERDSSLGTRPIEPSSKPWVYPKLPSTSKNTLETDPMGVIVSSFPPITKMDLINPLKHINSTKSTKWNILEVYKAFRLIVSGLSKKPRSEDMVNGGLSRIKTMSGGEINFKGAEQAMYFYHKNNIYEKQKEYEKIIKRDIKG